MSVASWRAIFLIFGGLTCACGIAFLIMMPKDTTTAWFLNAKERELATRRLAIDRATRDRAEFNKAQMWEAFRSPLTWMYFYFALCITLPSPILKVRTPLKKVNTEYGRRFNPRAVLFHCDQWLRVFQVPDHAPWDPRRRLQLRDRLDLSSRPALPPEHACLHVHFPRDPPACRLRCYVGCPCRPGAAGKHLGYCRGNLARLLYLGSPVRRRVSDSIQRQGQHEEVGRQCRVLHQLLRRVHR